jgi:hypothetical protein
MGTGQGNRSNVYKFEELREIAATPGWEGYLSSPAKATLDQWLAQRQRR